MDEGRGFLDFPAYARSRVRFRKVHMVGIAQLVERRIVVPDAEGSSPFTHPTLFADGIDKDSLSSTMGYGVTVTHQTLTLVL